jgi:2'-hydroxyisoflavone reductase
VIDVRDLAEWIVRMVEDGGTGVYNAAGDDGSTMGSYLEDCRIASGSDARFTWVDEGFLIEHEIGPWLELPLWIPEEDDDFFEVRKAIAAGLTFRGLDETVRDTLAWDRTTSFETTYDTGLDPAKEAKLLAEYARRQPA